MILPLNPKKKKLFFMSQEHTSPQNLIKVLQREREREREKESGKGGGARMEGDVSLVVFPYHHSVR